MQNDEDIEHINLADVTTNLKNGEEINIQELHLNFSIKQQSLLKMIKNFEYSKMNNINFHELLEDLQNNKKIVITDVMSKGKSLYTLLLLLESQNIPCDTLKFLYIYEYETNEKEVEEFKNNIIYNFDKFNIKFNYTNIEFIPNIILEPSYFQNSERTTSRCTSKYEVDNWGKKITNVYEGNYLNCNVHKLLYYISSSCFYDNFIKHHLRKQLIGYNIIMPLLQNFINEITYKNYMDGFDKKYLKYKTKYLKLKSKLN